MGTGASTGTPTITFGLPNPYSSSTPVVGVTATIGGVTMQSDIVVKLNGMIIPFTYAIKTKIISLSANLNMGPNTVSVTATNTSGAKTENLIINRP